VLRGIRTAATGHAGNADHRLAGGALSPCYSRCPLEFPVDWTTGVNSLLEAERPPQPRPLTGPAADRA